MPSPEFVAMFELLEETWNDRPADVAGQRAVMEELMSSAPVAAGTIVEPVTIAGRPAEWVRPGLERSEGVVLYLHGGAYRTGSPRAYGPFASHLAAAVGAPLLLLDYRLAPEHPFPAACDDAVAAYAELLAEGMESKRLAVMGDSAGGGLTVATLVAARDRGLAQPAAAVLLSPWVDLTVTADSFVRCSARDPVFNWSRAVEGARDYLGSADPHHPLASPFFADLSGIAPLLIHASDSEVLADDAVGLATRAEEAGVEVTLEVEPDMTHVWHALVPGVPEASRAVDRVGEFLRAAMA